MNHEQQPVTLNTIRIDRISPNPANSYITIEYNTLSSGQLKVYGMSLNTSSAYGLVKNSSEVAAANQQFFLDYSRLVLRYIMGK